MTNRVTCPRCGKSGFLTYRRVWNPYKPPHATTDGGLSRHYNKHAYFGHYDHEKYKTDMAKFKKGLRKSRPNGRVYCYVTDEQVDGLRGLRGTGLSRQLKEIGKGLIKCAKMMEYYPPTDPADQEMYTRMLTRYKMNFIESLEKNGPKTFLQTEKQQRIVAWRNKQLQKPALTSKARAEIERLFRYAYATTDDLFFVILHHREKYRLPHLKERQRRLAPFLGRFGEDAVKFPRFS